jgi:hypothetical protein
MVLFMAVVALPGCASRSNSPTSSGKTQNVLPSKFDNPLSLTSLLAAGHILLGPANSTERDFLGLGGPSPINEPPSSPFNKYGMYWSEHFAVIQGDVLHVTVSSDTPVSWFGIDWSISDIRGLLATTEMDEDGRTFNPLYPTQFSTSTGPTGYLVTADYNVLRDTECIIVVKNHNVDKSWPVSLSISSKFPFNIKRLLSGIPVIRGLFQSDQPDTD